MEALAVTIAALGFAYIFHDPQWAWLLLVWMCCGHDTKKEDYEK